jgi:DNA primase
MTLSPTFLDELRNRVPLSSLIALHVTWDMRKSNMAKGDWWAPCPFHHEKSASFHVDDQKGFFYCFGCHTKGDHFRFLQEREGKSFIEAAEAVAHLAGTSLPQRDSASARRSEAHEHLYQILEAASAWYRERLEATAGEHARDYLAGRGVNEDTAARWMIGYSPKTRPTLVDSFVARGVPLDHLVAAGLVIAEPGKPARDRFRDRIMIPIRDRRGRIISFGGRAMQHDAPAKYINGPQTPIFDKGKTLFNLAAARTALSAGQPLVVAEGYLDVISMVEAGFGATVAPLGTAVTADHLTLLLKAADECVFALDGDAAGLRAAYRVIDTAIPLLEAGKGIRFAILPTGQDPDDMIRAGAAEELRRLIIQSAPMVDLLWQRETEGRVLDSPERRAALEKRFNAAVARIKDPLIKQHYAAEVRGRLGRLAHVGDPLLVVKHGRPSRSGKPTARKAVPQRDHLEAVLLIWLNERPALLRRFRTELEKLPTSSQAGHALRDLLLLKDAFGGLKPDESQELDKHLSALMQDRDVAALIPGEAVTPTTEAFFAASALFKLRAMVNHSA